MTKEEYEYYRQQHAIQQNRVHACFSVLDVMLQEEEELLEILFVNLEEELKNKIWQKAYSVATSNCM